MSSMPDLSRAASSQTLGGGSHDDDASVCDGSVAGGGKGRSQPQQEYVRFLVELLLRKEPSTRGIEQKVAANNMKKVAAICMHLISHPEEIPTAEVMVLEGSCSPTQVSKSAAKGKRNYTPQARAQQLAIMNDSTTFDRSDVKVLGDVPDLWLWGYLQKITPHGIRDTTIAKMSEKSSKPVRLVVNFYTGFHTEIS